MLAGDFGFDADNDYDDEWECEQEGEEQECYGSPLMDMDWWDEADYDEEDDDF